MNVSGREQDKEASDRISNRVSYGGKEMEG